MNLPEIFFNPKKAQEKANRSSKKNTPREKGKGKKNSKVEKPNAVGHFLSKLWFLRMPGPKCLERDSSGKNG